MHTTRRNALGFGAGLGALVGTAGAAGYGARADAAGAPPAAPTSLVEPGGRDATRALRRAAQKSAESGAPLVLGPGEYRIGRLALPAGVTIVGAPGATRLVATSAGAGLVLDGADGVRLTGLTLEGVSDAPADPDHGLISARQCAGLVIEDCVIAATAGSGVVLSGCAGRVSRCTLTQIAQTAIFCLDGRGVDIEGNDISECGNNGVRVWRTTQGEDRTRVAGNRITNIRADRGGDGPHGNGVNVFRAGGVQVAHNLISDCAFSGFRANSADNLQVIGNSCLRLREVSIYVEFGFEGAIVSGNLVDDGAAGIEVTNFNNGGRLAVVQGNLIRNIKRRDDIVTRPHGMFVEADAAITGNVIENALTIGIQIGRGSYQRDVNCTGNTIRACPIGIGASTHRNAGVAVIANNLITGATQGAVRGFSDRTAVGPDLARPGAQTPAHLVVMNNVSRA